MPFEFLGLDRETASAKEVKREYARRLKTCRPDKDPEGFRVLHEAYNAALNEIRWRDTAGAGTVVSPPESEGRENAAPENVTPEEPGEIPEPPPAQNRFASHPEVLAALERLEAELRSGGKGIEPLVREAENALYRNPDAVIPWGQFLYRLINLYGSHPDLRLKSQALRFEMENNGALASLAVVERLDKTGNLMGISTLSNEFRNQAHQILTPACGAVAARLACAAAFWSPENTGSLADIAFQNLGRQEREHYVNEIEQHVHMRALLTPLPKRFQGFWRQKIMRVPGSPDWTSDEAVEAIEWISMKQVSGTHAAQVLRQLLPENLAEKIKVGPVGEIVAGKAPLAVDQQLKRTAETHGGGPAQLPETRSKKRRSVASRRILAPAVRHSRPIPWGFGVGGLILLIKVLLAFVAHQ